MHGVSRTSAALTVVNALPTGLGCAIGIERYVRATVDLEPERRAAFECIPPEAATPVVLASAQAALERFGAGEPLRCVVHLSSEVPPAKGLKSSSAVATATIRAAARALGSEPMPLEVARLAAGVGRRVGVSATGALDDALAGLLRGFVVTDNLGDELIAGVPADPSWTAVVYLPPGKHPPSPDLRKVFDRAREEGRAAADHARGGRFAEAMSLNTELVERIMGYDYRGLRQRLRSNGALAAGVSGFGPALGALVPIARVDEVLAALPRGVGERFAVHLTREDAP
jgi:shikimate kinase